MKVAIVGAGALGLAYGALLSVRGNVQVTLVVRPKMTSDTRAIILERVEKEDVTVDKKIARADHIPSDSDVVIVAVRGDQLDDALLAMLKREDGPTRSPIVVLTPMMPRDFDRLSHGLGKRVLAAMPNITSYVSPKTDEASIIVRYWMPRMATTLIEMPRPTDAAIADLVTSLNLAGVATRLEMGVHEINPATTITFIPLAMALDAASGLDALMADDKLLAIAIDAAREASELGLRIGKPAVWATMLTKFLSVTMLKLGVSIARKRSAEGVRYIDHHFGRKLHAQNVAMAEAIIDLAREKASEHRALDLLLTRLREVPT